MTALLLFVGWCLLLVVSWPLALLALVLAPLVCHFRPLCCVTTHCARRE